MLVENDEWEDLTLSILDANNEIPLKVEIGKLYPPLNTITNALAVSLCDISAAHNS